jgi:hypothetical protein
MPDTHPPNILFILADDWGWGDVDQHPDLVARMSERVLAWQATLPEGPFDPTAGSNAYLGPGRPIPQFPNSQSPVLWRTDVE